jgi:flagellar FliJ protein
MDSPNSWMRLKQIAEQKRDVTARTYASLASQRKDAQQKLQLLLDYRLDYQARLESASRMGIRGEGLRNYQGFLANLERAIEQQTDLMTSLQAQVTAAQKKVSLEHRRTESFQVLDDRRNDLADTKDRRRQQALQDEIANRLHLKLVR